MKTPTTPILRILFASALLCSSLAAQGYDREDWKARVPTFFHDAAATITIVDEDTVQVDNFHYDGGGDGIVYFMLGADNTQASFVGGLPIGPNLFGTVYAGDSLTIDLPAAQTLDGYTAISLWCEPAQANFGSASFEYPRKGWQAELSTLAHNVSGSVTIADEDTLQVDDFFYDGLGIDVFFYLGTANTNPAFSNGLSIGPDLVGTAYNGASFSLDLPGGQDLDGWNAVSVWCVTAGANFGSGSFKPQLGLEVSGTCPGTLRVDVAGATPGQKVALVFAAAPGAVVVPNGPCAGLTLGLGNPGLRLVTLGTVSGSGDWILLGSAPAAACGGYLQVVDLAGCSASPVVQIP